MGTRSSCWNDEQGRQVTISPLRSRDSPRNLSLVIPQTIEDLQSALDSQDYFAGEDLVVAMHLALQLGRPLFLEGEAGVGKTEVAKVLAAMTGEDLIRLQCYEGLDVGHALYEWDYALQMMEIRLLEARGEGERATARDIMSRDFLIARPLLQAIEAAKNGRRPVLLIDELDRADEEFEAFLLELLSDFQVTIPEIGTIAAEHPPIVVLTSNRTREIHDALKRRCIYHWIDYPTPALEASIVVRKVPGIDKAVADNLARAMGRLREMDLFKPPGVAETLDWAQSLQLLHDGELTTLVANRTLGVVLKYKDDIDAVREAGLEALVS
jgi:MoxR-like ATPase